MRQKSIYIVDTNIKLLAPEKKYANDLHNLIINDQKRLSEFLDFIENSTSVMDQEKFIQDMIDSESKGNAYLFIIEYKGTIVGCIDLHKVAMIENKKVSEMGYWVQGSYGNKGIATKCVTKLTQIGFNELNINEIQIVVDKNNLISSHVAENSGYKLLGEYSNRLIFKGNAIDAKVYSKKRLSES